MDGFDAEVGAFDHYTRLLRRLLGVPTGLVSLIEPEPTLISGKSVLPGADDTDIYLTAFAMILTLVYATGLLFGPRHRTARMGADSLAVLILYAIGIAGLFTIAG